MTNDKEENPLKILIVDDDKEFLDFIRGEFLLHRQYQVYTASDEDNGLSMAKEVLPDIILLDVMMPGKGGLDVLRELKEDQNTSVIPVAMLTAVGSFEARLQALRLYCEGYIEKPCTCQEIISVIETVINRRIECRSKI